MPDRPNVLFLMDDEHRPDVLGYAGDDVVRTPNIDRLAETGVTFENAYTPAPRCVPGRQCMSAGQLPRTSGCERWGEGLDPRSMTFARRLAQYGYDTVAAGKLHHIGEDKSQGWTQLIGRSGGSAVDRVEDDVESSRPDRVKWSDAKEVRRAGVGRSDVGWKSRIDEYRTQGACDFLTDRFLDPHYDREQRDRPLMLKVSLSQPHYPYHTTQERFEYYLDRVEPYVDEEAFDDHGGLSRRRVHVRDDDGRRHEDRAGSVSPRDVRRATAAYYGMIETVDEYYGRVLDRLEHVGEDLDDWIVIYTSDHGEMLGQHGIWEKGHHFEASAGVPLVIRYPERFDPGTVEENVTLCDLFATLCDLADVPLPEDHTLDSRSMVGLLEGDDEDWTDEAVSAEGDRCMIRQGDLKYLHFPDDPDVLFDLAADPGETTNLIDDPDYAGAVDRLRARRDELGYGPDADPEYRDAGYDPGVATAD